MNRSGQKELLMHITKVSKGFMGQKMEGCEIAKSLYGSPGDTELKDGVEHEEEKDDEHPDHAEIQQYLWPGRRPGELYYHCLESKKYWSFGTSTRAREGPKNTSELSSQSG